MTAPRTTRSVAGPVTTPRELFSARLRQTLWVELRLAEEVLPPAVGQARATALRFGFERHLPETRDHAKTLRAVLHELEAPADPEESPALSGLVLRLARQPRRGSTSSRSGSGSAR